ncbi:6990_t:CDS:2 [Gigaspora margarita]|uniref:6990_t:CDS:1 n=1 Tax=Gigaspora margarita TaxID=4874 RepID=A0ABN7VNJ1_GIGMA|nr:6990_t:CDS:2 [Gigaspora margarita]
MSNSATECAMNTMASAVKVTAEIVSSYVPIVETVKILVEEICKIYTNVECNKELCFIMMNRVKIAEFALEQMMMRVEENDEYFYEKEYYLSLQKFVNVLTDIKNFVEKVSKFKSVRTFFEANKIKQMYDKLTQEFDTCMNDLHFTIAIANENQRAKDSQKVDQVLKNLEKLDIGIDGMDNKLDGLEKNISLIMNKMNIRSGDVHAQRINENDLTKPTAGRNSNGTVIRKYYKGIEVACKPIKDSNQKQGELAILEQLRLSPNILIFYGLAYFDNNDYMILEWADRGSLKELYDKYDIPWDRKIQITRDICNGLIFLRNLNILHHDIRCENVFITKNLDPKLGNFRYARETSADTTSLSFQKQLEMFRWMAPEQILKCRQNPNKKGYTFNCEMFRTLELKKVPDFVLSGKRERLTSGNFENANDATIQKNELEKLAEENPISHSAPQLFENNKFDFGTTSDVTTENSKLPKFDEPLIYEDADSLMTVDEGIGFHREKNYESAWKCFEKNSELGNPLAQYWQAYYLFNGYFVDQDKEHANQLFKQQLQMRNTGNPNISEDEKRNEILRYLKLASNNKNSEATYQLGNIYVNGKLKTQQSKENKELGLIYLELASQYGNQEATKLLRSLR